jgi:hypothetical protein
MPDYEEELNWDSGGEKTDNKMSLGQSVKAIIIPLLIQVVCVLIVSIFDPCNNNPGCMAGNITAYSAILILPSTLVILLFVTFVEVIIKTVEYKKALKINSILAIVPFILVLLALAKYS